MTHSVNRRRPAHEGGNRVGADLGGAPVPTSTKTRRAALNRRALVPRGACGTRPETWDALRSRPPSTSAGHHLASTLRLPARLRSSRPMTPRRPPVVAHSRHPSKYDHLTVRYAPERIAIAVFPHLPLNGFNQGFELRHAQLLERCDAGLQAEFFGREAIDLLA